MNKDIAVYPAVFTYEPDGIVITFPDLNGCISEADTQEDAIAMARDALGSWLAGNDELKYKVSKPSRVSDIIPEPNQSVTLVDVWLPLYREKKFSGSVKKNVTIPIWLNSMAEKAGINFSQVLQAGIKSSLGIQDR